MSENPINPIVKVLTEALRGRQPVSIGVENLADVGRPDVLSLGLRFLSAREAEEFVQALEAGTEKVKESLEPDHRFIHAAPGRVQ